MNLELRLPNITATTPNAQMSQMQSYMHQLVQQLNWALNSIDNEVSTIANTSAESAQNQDISQNEALDTFNSIKALIIKSSDIVEAFEEKWEKEFNGKYFADSDFGTYLETTRLQIEANSRGVSENYSSVQSITNDDGTGTLDTLSEDVRTTNAYIKRGILGYDSSGNAIIGIEIGETGEDGVFSKYARFTSDRLSFFDFNGYEVAYIGSGCLYIRGKSVFLGEIQMGGYKLDTSDGLAFTWVGGV